jgi:hypothetical protein
MNYFIIIVNDQSETKSLAQDIYNHLMSESIWGFGEHTQNLKKISEGDKLVYYLAGKNGQKFVGTARVASPPALSDREEYRSKYWFKLDNVHIWQEPRPIAEYFGRLDFIVKPKHYGTYLQGGSRLISKSDYLTIIDPIYDQFVQGSSEEIIAENEPLVIDKSKLLQQANNFTNTKESHIFKVTAQKVRVESRAQKQLIAALEDYQCQLCGWQLEWTNEAGKMMRRIDIDHIIDKAIGGTEETSNLWALCPNCHAKKTAGVITVDLGNHKVFESGNEIHLKSDHHLKW